MRAATMSVVVHWASSIAGMFIGIKEMAEFRSRGLVMVSTPFDQINLVTYNNRR